MKAVATRIQPTMAAKPTATQFVKISDTPSTPCIGVGACRRLVPAFLKGLAGEPAHCGGGIGERCPAGRATPHTGQKKPINRGGRSPLRPAGSLVPRPGSPARSGSKPLSPAAGCLTAAVRRDGRATLGPAACPAP